MFVLHLVACILTILVFTVSVNVLCTHDISRSSQALTLVRILVMVFLFNLVILLQYARLQHVPGNLYLPSIDM